MSERSCTRPVKIQNRCRMKREQSDADNFLLQKRTDIHSKVNAAFKQGVIVVWSNHTITFF